MNQGYPAPQPGYGMPPQQGSYGGPPTHGMPPQGGQPGYGMQPQGGQPGYGMPPQGGQPGYGMQPQGGQPGYGMAPQGGQPPQGMPPQGGPPQTMPGMPQGHAQQPQRFQPGTGGPVNMDDVSDTDSDSSDEEAEEKKRPVAQDAYQQFQGYEMVGDYDSFQSVGPPPPAMMPQPPQGEPPHMQFKNAADISEQEARTALLEMVAQHCCYGKGCAEDMTITSIAPSMALHYLMESYCESRSTARKHTPFKGQYIDGPENGYPPQPWQIPCQPDQLFKDHKKNIEVPHTAYVRSCHRCRARGFIRCRRCHGCGQVRCTTCGGNGRRMVHRNGESHQERCSACGGDGRKRCIRCGGDGRVTCPVCNGYRNLKHYILLTVTYKIHDDDHIIEETDMPDELIRDVGGIIIFEQTLPMVWPITAYPVQEINQRSIAIVESHRTKFPDKVILQQRHNLRAVPVTEVAYKWKDVSTRFWVFGQERRVHAPDYPQQCCWGCQIL